MYYYLLSFDREKKLMMIFEDTQNAGHNLKPR